MPGALDGVIIADFTQMMQGPWASQKLAEMGANVIKIERIGGEWERKLEAGGELLDGVSPFFLAMNRNKQSIELNLKSDQGKEIALEIIEEADVLMENFRPGVMDRFGLGYEDVKERNPNIVYVSGTGFGSTGPYTDRPGQDLLLQAMSGLTEYTGRAEDPPTPVGTAVVDEHSATLMTLNTMFALFHQERTGEGQKVEVNLLNSAIDFQCQEITAVLNMDQEFGRSDSGVAQAWLSAPYGIYETADGYIAIAMASMESITKATGIEELRDYDTPEKTYEHRDEIKRRLEEYTREQPTDELLEALLAEDIWAANVNNFHEMAEDPQVTHNEMIVELEHPETGETFKTTGLPASLSETPPEIDSRPPRSGEHTGKVLADWGYDESEIEKLAEDGIIGDVNE